jgi:hypothetical protein
MTTTRPDADSAVFAFSYIDTKDKAPNEDAFLFEFDPPRVTHYPGTSLEKLFREYVGTHHGPKDFFVFPDEAL